jgi:hypothetical protein
MKRILLLVSAIVLGCTTMFAQSIEIIRPNGNHSINDSIIEVEAAYANSDLMSVPLWIINKSGSSINVKCKWEDSVRLAKTWNSVCWVLCYGANVSSEWQAPSNPAIAPGDTNETFAGDFYDTAHTGCETIRYVFYNASNVNDSAWVLVRFCVSPLSVPQIEGNTLHISAPYPNPSGSYTSFNYHITSDAHLTIYNSIGQSLRDILLSPSANKTNLNVSDMPSGVYICRLSSAGAEPIFQKLIVAH